MNSKPKNPDFSATTNVLAGQEVNGWHRWVLWWQFSYYKTTRPPSLLSISGDTRICMHLSVQILTYATLTKQSLSAAIAERGQ